MSGLLGRSRAVRGPAACESVPAAAVRCLEAQLDMGTMPKTHKPNVLFDILVSCCCCRSQVQSLLGGVRTSLSRTLLMRSSLTTSCSRNTPSLFSTARLLRSLVLIVWLWTCSKRTCESFELACGGLVAWRLAAQLAAPPVSNILHK